MQPESHVGKEVTLIEAVEVDLKLAANVRLVIRMVVEHHIVDLDRAVVSRRDARLQAPRNRRAPRIRRGLPPGLSGVRIEQHA